MLLLYHHQKWQLHLVLLNTYKREGGIWEPHTYYLFLISLQVITWIQTMAANATPIRNATLTQLLKLHCFIFNGPYLCVLASGERWQGEALMEHRASSEGSCCFTWLQGAPKQMVWQVTCIGTPSSTGWLVSVQPKEPPWDPGQKCQKLHTNTKSNHKCYLSSKYSAFTFSPPVAAALCTLQGLCLSLSGKEFEWENKIQWDLLVGAKLTRRGKRGAVTHKGRSISMNRVTECSFRTSIKGPLAQKQQSSNPSSAPPESQEITQGKKPKPLTPCVRFAISFQCTLQKHWSKQNFGWKIKYFSENCGICPYSIILNWIITK